MRNHLQFNWWKYLAVIVLPVILWCSVFSAIAEPNSDQQVNVLYVGESLDTQSLRQQLADAMPQLTQQQIKSVAVDTALLDGSSYNALLTARCFDYDILILEESSLQKNTGQTVFTRLTSKLLEQFPNTPHYTEEVEDGGTLAFGLVLYDGTAENTFSACYTGSQTCYLFISPYSVNFDTLNENGTAGNDAALKAAQYLLSHAN